MDEPGKAPIEKETTSKEQQRTAEYGPWLLALNDRYFNRIVEVEVRHGGSFSSFFSVD